MSTTQATLDAIRAVVGPQGWIAEEADMAPYLVEERGLYHGSCALVARPASVAETAEVVRLCAAGGVPIVAQGGNTGLVGGGVPDGGIVLSTGRLKRIRALDPLNHTITVEAGCVLANVQEAAEEAGLLFPLSLGSEGSCQIGGNLSTNAGGVAVLRYGNARDLVLGLEVVLPDGTVWEGLRALRKDNAGFELKHLFIGAEGTLGIITAAVLKLFPAPRTRERALAGAGDLKSVLGLFARARAAAGDSLTAFEMMSRRCMELACRHNERVRDPFAAPHAYYASMELTSPRPGEPLLEALESLLSAALEDGEVTDTVIAASTSQARDLWRIRETITEAQKHEGASIKYDVSVPVSRVPEFVASARILVEAELPGIRVVDFGHMGDGNVHFNLSQPEGADGAAFLAQREHFNRIVHDLAVGMGGSFSAEHGIGTLKRDDLVRYKPAVEVDLMRRLKAALDPNNIMNPGKVL